MFKFLSLLFVTLLSILFVLQTYAIAPGAGQVQIRNNMQTLQQNQQRQEQFRKQQQKKKQYQNNQNWR